MTLETQCLLYSLEYIWCTNKGPPEPEGEHAIKRGFELKTSPYDHCVPPGNKSYLEVFF